MILVCRYNVLQGEDPGRRSGRWRTKAGARGEAPGEFFICRESCARQPSSCVPLHAQIPVRDLRSPAANAFRRFVAGRWVWAAFAGEAG